MRHIVYIELSTQYITITTWKVPVFGVILVRIFPHLDWIRTRITPNTDTFYAVNVIGRTRIFNYSQFKKYYRYIMFSLQINWITTVGISWLNAVQFPNYQTHHTYHKKHTKHKSNKPLIIIKITLLVRISVIPIRWRCCLVRKVEGNNQTSVKR